MTELRVHLRTALLITALGLVSMAVTGCFENTGNSRFSSSITGVSGTSGTNQTAANTLVISNVGIAASSVGTGGYLTTVYFNPTSSTSTASNFCSSQSSTTSTTGNLCVCNFSWVENNTTSGTTVPITHGVQTTVLNVQNSLVTCNAPPTFSGILNGTVISVSVLAGTGNASSFADSPFQYTKTNSGTSDFQDAQGDSFQDVLRYTCFEQYYRGLAVSSQLFQITNPNGGGTATAPLANSFCVQTAQGNPSSTQCTGQLPAQDYSSQSYYYNLYIRDSEQGDINLSNARYFCPSVQEALGNNGTVGTENKPWPLDRTFALSLGATTVFNVGVQAFTQLSDGSSDPTAQGSSCGSTVTTASPTPAASGTGSSSGNTLVSSCLGFAAAPNANGTCPYFRDSNNQIRFTYRLRKYFTVYPAIFDADGSPLQQAQSSDTIYVLDRPVNNGANPLQPYTMAGPKPCPWSYYDRSGANGVPDANYPETGLHRPGYFATNNSLWNGKNVDGAQFPHIDSPNSCSATIPVPNSTKTAISLATVSGSNPVYSQIYIRPVTAWAPHYVEDTSFLACAPQSSTIQDPPLHFSKDVNGNVGYCAEAYPSQNPNVSGIDPYNGGLPQPPYAVGNTFAGGVSPYTSHVVKNSSNAVCTFSALTLPSGYPAVSNGACGAGVSTGLAGHPSNFVVDPLAGAKGCALNTCDRTASTVAGDWTKFPLLAPAADVEAAITNDISNYGCLVTYDNNGSKTGLASPSGGCCASPSTTLTTGSIGAGTAHLEPGVSCLTPNY